MGLRDYLDSLQTGAQGFQEAGKTADDMRKQAAMQSFAQAAPSLIQNQDVGGLVQNALNTGDMSLANDVTKGIMAQKTAEVKAKAKPEDIADANFVSGLEKSANLPPGSLSYTIGVKRDEALKAAGLQDRDKNFAIGQANAQSKFNMGKDIDIEKGIGTVGQHVAQLENKIDSDKAAVESAWKSFQEKPTAAAAGALIIAKIKLDSGSSRITEGERQAYGVPAAISDMNQLANYWSAQQNAVMSNDQVAELGRLVNNTIKDSESKKIKESQNFIQNTLNNKYALVKEDGTPRPSTVKLLQDHGMKLTFDENGNPQPVIAQFTIPKSVITSSGDVDNKAIDQLVAALKKKDPSAGQDAEEAVNKARASKRLTPATAQDLQKVIYEELGVKQ